MICLLWLLLGALLLLAGGAGLFHLLLTGSGKRGVDPAVTPLLRQALSAVNGSLESNEFGSCTGLAFSLGHAQARLTIPDRNGPAIVEYALPYYLPPIFALRPAAAPPTMFGKGQIAPMEVGDARFGERFTVRTSNANLAQEILSPEVRAAIGALPRTLHPTSERLSISLGANLLRIEAPAIGGSALDLPGFLDGAGRIARAFFAALGCPVGVEAGLRIVEGGAQERMPGACRVCGEAFTGRPVLCRRCRTPHHRECWEYFGACSTFACNTREYEE